MDFRTSITRRYHFEAAHFLPLVPDGHKCKNMHGHNYELEVTIGGSVRNDGFIIDFWELDKVVQPLIDKVDHHVLNELPGLDNPTAEHIAAWFLLKIRLAFGKEQARVIRMRVFETKDCWADVSTR